MNDKKTFCVLMVMFFVLVFATCSGKKNPAESTENEIPQTIGIQVPESQMYNSQVRNEELDIQALSEEMQKLAIDFQAGKVKMDDYVKRLEELQQKMMQAITAESPASNTSSANSNEVERFVDPKYCGRFNSTKTFFTSHQWGEYQGDAKVALYINNNGAEFAVVFLNGSANEQTTINAYTEGNSLMSDVMVLDEKTGYKYQTVKLGTFTDTNTFVYEADEKTMILEMREIRGANTTERITFKRE